MARVAQQLQRSVVHNLIFHAKIANIDSRRQHLDHRAAMIEAVVEAIREEDDRDKVKEDES
jgi:hypothetical protein